MKTMYRVSTIGGKVWERFEKMEDAINFFDETVKSNKYNYVELMKEKYDKWGMCSESIKIYRK